jgi:hypothetical protein
MRDVVHPGRRDRPEGNEEATVAMSATLVGWLESASGSCPTASGPVRRRLGC